MFQFKRKPLSVSKDNEYLLSAYERAIEECPKQRRKAVRDNIAKVMISDYPIETHRPLWTGVGNSIFFDSWTKVRFYSDYNVIESGLSKANKRLKSGDTKVPFSDIFSDWHLNKIANLDHIRKIGFTEPIEYEIKVVSEGAYDNNVILFITRPHIL